jgi:hypothetical protein
MADDHVHELLWKNLPIDTPDNVGFLYRKIEFDIEFAKNKNLNFCFWLMSKT